MAEILKVLPKKITDKYEIVNDTFIGKDMIKKILKLLFQNRELIESKWDY